MVTPPLPIVASPATPRTSSPARVHLRAAGRLTPNRPKCSLLSYMMLHAIRHSSGAWWSETQQIPAARRRRVSAGAARAAIHARARCSALQRLAGVSTRALRTASVGVRCELEVVVVVVGRSQLRTRWPVARALLFCLDRLIARVCVTARRDRDLLRRLLVHGVEPGGTPGSWTGGCSLSAPPGRELEPGRFAPYFRK